MKELQAHVSSSDQIHQTLSDEHDALQLAFSSVEKKLQETEKENDRLVCVHTHTLCKLFMYVCIIERVRNPPGGLNSEYWALLTEPIS